MRQTDRASSVLRLVLPAALAVAILATSAHAQSPSTRWRSSRYGRAGAEIWAEYPLLTFPSGGGYREEYDLQNGLGFGFGLMFGISDKLGVEGRIAQTRHKAVDDREWDLDQYYAGFRYFFRHEEPLQPYVGLGGARLSLEWTNPDGGLTEFERIWGYGAYVAAGADYVISSQWVAGLRANYVWVRYTRANNGTQESDLEDPLDGSSIGLSLSVHYRIPIAW